MRNSHAPPLHTLVISLSLLLFTLLIARVGEERMIVVNEEVEDANVKEFMLPILGPDIDYCNVQSYTSSLNEESTVVPIVAGGMVQLRH